jgi:hypothetical protein
MRTAVDWSSALRESYPDTTYNPRCGNGTALDGTKACYCPCLRVGKTQEIGARRDLMAAGDV